MKPHLVASVAVLLAVTVAEAAPVAPSTESGPVVSAPRDGSMRRYHQLRRLDRREFGRPAFQQGATCVTPKLVCWVPQPGDAGDPCSCATPSRARVSGTIDG